MNRLRNPVVSLVACAAFGRGALLLLVVVCARTHSGDQFDALVYALAAGTAVQILLDPNTGAMLVVRWRRGMVDYADWLGGLRLQAVVALGVMLLTAGIVGAGVGSQRGVVLGLALGAMFGAESLARYARCVWQTEGRLGRYAATDLLVGLGRVAVAAALIGSGGLGRFEVAAVVVAAAWTVAVLVGVARKVGFPANLDVAPIRTMLRAVWPYGLSTALSAAYAQAPTILIGLVGGLRAAAVYGVAARMTQASELLPASLSAVFLPRLAATTGDSQQDVFRRQIRAAAATGGLACVVCILAAPVALPLLGVPWHEGSAVVLLLALALLPKFLSYQYVSLALTQGQVRARLGASGVIAVVSVVGVLALAHVGATPVAAVTLACELGLLGLLFWMTHDRAPTPVPSLSS
jgi:O-antigen/teichoic acid export membrane protein